MVVQACAPKHWRDESRQIPRAPWPALPPESVFSRFNEKRDPASNKTRWLVTEKETKVDLCPPYVWSHACKCNHIHVCFPINMHTHNTDTHMHTQTQPFSHLPKLFCFLFQASITFCHTASYVFLFPCLLALGTTTFHLDYYCQLPGSFFLLL